MKLYLIADSIDAVTGMRLAGVEGEVAADAAQAQKAIEKICADGEYAVLIVSHSLTVQCRGVIDGIRRTRSLPLIVDLPDEGV